ncbi:MAG: hypothetical protein H6Q84_834 [Deltaproteobacteria bacterium]|nr:hypothetical protein [Deltaproteobacteria bacterium]
MADNRCKGVLLGMTAAGILMIAAAAVSAGTLEGIFKKSPADVSKAAGVTETAGAVKIPLKSLDPGKALFLSMDAGGRQVRYFALRSPDGAYRAALDACDVCYRSNKGYRQEGDRMVCNNCGQTFASDRIGKAKGGCNPHPLANKVEAGSMVIAKSDISAGKEYFPGNGR